MKHLDFTVIDLFCMEFAWIVAYFWRFGSWLFENPPYVRIAILLVLIDIMVIFFGESYSGILRRTKYQEFTATLIHCIIVFGGVLMYMYATKQSWIYSRQMLFMFLGLMFFFEYGGRVVWKRRVRRASGRGMPSPADA